MPADIAASTNSPPLKVVFRADASPLIGGGHVMRCLALANGLQSEGAECWFGCAAGTTASVPALIESGYRYSELSASADAEALQRTMPGGCDWLVVDHYGWSFSEEARCRRWARNILVIDDLANRQHDCDLLLDQTFGRRSADYNGLVPARSGVLVGSQYALLRNEFAEARSASLACRMPSRLKRILVSLGLTDPANMTQTILEGILASRLSLTVDVVLG